MSIVTEIALESFVLLRLGERRFALKANQIAELVAPSRVFRFPHHTAALEGVLLRRGRIVPVCDVSERLVGKKLTMRRFYLIANRFWGSHRESVALPVSGDCELITAEMTPRSESDSPHVAGWLSHGGDVIEILNLEALTPGPHAARSNTAAFQPVEVRA
ncbi:MAG TPA: chemotaxis protein CheW [Candidatus Sulfotelmatobacter sp.]|jgi:chemotaxis signal transduction protein|nr:chemotaxis protein CheW [Candidatus Sulfotelmatobacter sp.]